jgi:hypothetical protein
MLVVVALIAVSCGGGDDDDSGPAPLATPEAVRTTIWERSFSECSSESLKKLAAKYDVDPVPADVALAVGKTWSQRFDGGADAVRSGRDGCQQGLATQ